jgi:hypothetical protein
MLLPYPLIIMRFGVDVPVLRGEMSVGPQHHLACLETNDGPVKGSVSILREYLCSMP